MKSYVLTLLVLLCAGLAAPSTAAASSEDNEEETAEGYFTARVSGSLWETLVDNGVNPTLWRAIFSYNRANNPAFARISSANRIPRNTTVFIPYDINGVSVEQGYGGYASRPARSAIADTLALDSGWKLVEIKAGRRDRLNDVIEKFCLPGRDAVGDKRLRSNMVRNIRADIRDLYRRQGWDLSYRANSFRIPLHLLAEHYEALESRLERIYGSPEHYVPRDSILETSIFDIRHVVAAGETYQSLAGRYIPAPDGYPSDYPFVDDNAGHLAYMAQHIRHYNLNQELCPGHICYIPGYLLEGRYYEQNPPVRMKRMTSKSITYANGLEVKLDYHVTRRKAYWKHRQKYLPPLPREFDDGSPAFPDMVLWHRTGLDPEVEKVLREKGRKQFSLRYIYRLAVCNYYIDEAGNCFLVVDPDKNSRDHSGNPADYRCFWNGVRRVSDVSIGIEIEGGFLTELSREQLETARKLQEVLRGIYMIPDDRVLDHKKVASRRGPGLKLYRGRKSDGLTTSDRLAMGIKPVLDPDVLRGVVDPNLNDMRARQADSTDFWHRVEIDPDLIRTARIAGWLFSGDSWQGPQDSPAAGRGTLTAD